jgi:low temperature requirement protein LtrA
MVARPTDEEHRSATVLELFFDLCFVVAVASAASALHHEVADGHVGDGVVGYATVFFAIWWAWMNFTWFASAYDTDDVAYRLTTLVQIAGALILAAGVPDAMAGGDFAVITVGYVVMRLAMVTQWLRAAGSDPPHRRSSLRFAAGIGAVQVGWVLRLFLPQGLGYAGFLVLAAAELAVPIWAERAAPTTWHPRHIAERYGLFTLIVLGECVLSSTLAIEAALAEDAALARRLRRADVPVVVVVNKVDTERDESDVAAGGQPAGRECEQEVDRAGDEEVVEQAAEREQQRRIGERRLRNVVESDHGDDLHQLTV